MSGDCCFQNRPPLERIRNLCIVCLVLDAIFLLINGLTALSATANSAKIECYEAHGYSWHNLVTLSFMLSTAMAAGGVMLHSMIACGSQIEAPQLKNISRFSHILICWTFMSAIIETIAYRQEPLQCADQGTGSQTPSNDAESAYHYYFIWQLVYTILVLAWVTSTVATAILARRVLAQMEQGTLDTSGQVPTTTMPQTVGWPVQMQDGQQQQHQQVGPGMTTFAGVPCGPGGPTAMGAVGAPGGAPPWQAAPDGTTVMPGGVVVAQGRPVAGSSDPPPNPDKPAGSVAKTVD